MERSCYRALRPTEHVPSGRALYDDLQTWPNPLLMPSHSPQSLRAKGEPRTAQTFVCCGPGNVTADVINVHAPSGKKSLTDKQRIALLTNLLQSNSQSMPGQEIGRARFLIGGDMNTSSITASEIASVIAVSATATEHGCLGWHS